MAISALPVDGLINRLIQQNQRPAVRSSGSSPDVATLRDQVNISSQAKAHASGANEQVDARGPTDANGQSDVRGQAGMQEQTPSPLESKLLDMYKVFSGSAS